MTTGTYDSIFITSARDLVIEEPLGRGFEFRDGVYLTNDPEVLKGIVSPQLAVMMGELEYHHLIGNGYAFFSWASIGDNDPLAILNAWLYDVHIIQQALWLSKDNSVHCEMGFVESVSEGEARFSSNFINAIYTNAEGVNHPTVFSIEELSRAKEYYDSVIYPLLDFNTEGKFPSIPVVPAVNFPARVINPKGVPRLRRLLYILTAARRSDELSTKISLYISAFEILFSNDATELTFKLSMRVAYFLGASRAERAEIVRTLKKAYAVRSRFLHGDVISRQMVEDIYRLAPQVDLLLRRCIQKIGGDSILQETLEGVNEAREQYFEELVIREG